ncbi:MAG TPA: toprim domain-containing protein [Methanomassiliicoccales archaeon]|nr:toprim domain-containing protein [Methanomassiliicoccales archaeon]
MRDAEETLKDLDLLLQELRERPNNCTLLVEGKKDKAALWVLGVEGDVMPIQNGRRIFQVAEELAREGREAIILTDWDRKGGQFCRLLKQALKACGVPYDDAKRAKLARLSKKEIKDVESLPAFMSRLVAETQKTY